MTIESKTYEYGGEKIDSKEKLLELSESDKNLKIADIKEYVRKKDKFEVMKVNDPDRYAKLQDVINQGDLRIFQDKFEKQGGFNPDNEANKDQFILDKHQKATNVLEVQNQVNLDKDLTNEEKEIKNKEFDEELLNIYGFSGKKTESEKMSVAESTIIKREQITTRDVEELKGKKDGNIESTEQILKVEYPLAIVDSKETGMMIKQAEDKLGDKKLEKRELKEKAEIMQAIDAKLQNSTEEQETKFGKGFVDKAKTFLKVQIKDSYQLKNLKKIIFGGALMLASPYTSIAAPMVFSYGMKKFVEGGASALQWGFSKEKKELMQVNEKQIVINEMLESGVDDKETLERALKSTIDIKYQGTNLQLNEIIARAEFKQKQIDKISSYIGTTASVANLVVGAVPMDLNMDGVTHWVRPAFGKYLSDAGAWKHFWQMGASEVAQMGGQSLLALAAIFGEKEINKKLGDKKSWLIGDNKISAKVIEKRVESENVEDTIKRKTPEAKPKVESEKTGEKTKEEKAEDVEKKKWLPGRFEDINDYAVNMNFAEKQKNETQKLMAKESMKNSILKNLNVWDKEIKSLSKLSIEEKDNFRDYQTDLKRVLVYTDSEILDPRIQNFLNNKVEEYKPLEK